MKNTRHALNRYPLLRYGDLPGKRLFRILHCVLTLNELPEDMTHTERDAVLHQLIETYIEEDGSHSYRLTDYGDAFMCEFLFRNYDHTLAALTV